MSNDTPTDPMDTHTRLKMLYTALGYVDGLHDQIDKVRHFPRGSHGALMACSGAGPADDERYATDYDIEQAQRGLETAFLRLQQAISRTDPEVCTGPHPCSDERGPCDRHATSE